MILEFIFNLLFAIANFLVGLFPAFPSFNSLNISLDPLLYVLRLVNMFVSLRLIGTCLIIILIIYNIKFVWSILMWIVRKIPGVS